MIDRTAPDCIFCKIVRREITANEITRTDDAVVFADLDPKAPTHLLVIPARHAANLGDFVAVAPRQEVGDLFALASAAGRAASPGGYRLVVNEGLDGGQTVFHLHVHVFAGRAMTWPPG
ncbi:MAG TPA: HIT domain-containing protein [Candidatus Baltobacteraceae bacterium]